MNRANSNPASQKNKKFRKWGGNSKTLKHIALNDVSQVKYDQLKVNKDKFNVITGYKDEFYTTKLDLNKISKK